MKVVNLTELKSFSPEDIDKFCISKCQFQPCTTYDCPIFDFVEWLKKGRK